MKWANTRARRLLVVVSLPIWVPICLAAGVLLFVAAVMLLAATLLWCPWVRVVSWVYYGDQYVLGNWWWTLDDEAAHEERTARARIRAGLHPDPWMETDSRDSGET